MSARPDRAWLRRLLRLGVSAALITWVVVHADLGQVGAVLRGANLALIGVALASYFVGYVASVMRWRTLLAAHDVRPGFGYLYASFMIGMFFNQLLPTTVGGDLARYQYTAGSGRAAALGAVLLDRVFGGVSLMLFASVGLALAARGSALPEGLPQAVAALLGVGLLALALAFVAPAALLERARRGVAFLPSFARALVDKLGGAFAAFRGRYDVVLAALLWSLALQCVVVAHYYLVGLALGLAVPLQAYAFIVPVALIIMMVPISINGIGVRESVFAYLLGLYGVDLATSLVFAWVIYAMVLAQGLLGGAVFAVVRARRRETAPSGVDGA